jgi:hypothetical protein
LFTAITGYDVTDAARQLVSRTLAGRLNRGERNAGSSVAPLRRLRDHLRLSANKRGERDRTAVA